MVVSSEEIGKPSTMISTLIQHHIIDLMISGMSSTYRENEINWKHDLLESSMSLEMWREWVQYTLVSKNWLKYISTHISIAYLSIGLIDALFVLNNLKELIHCDRPLGSNTPKALMTPTHLIRKITTRIDASRHEQIYPLLYNLKKSHYSNLQSLTIHFSIFDEPNYQGLSHFSREDYRNELNNAFTNYKQLYSTEWTKMLQENGMETLEKTGLLEKDKYYTVAKFLVSLPTDNVSIHLHLDNEVLVTLVEIYSFTSINTDIININRFTINCSELDQPIKSLLSLFSHNQYNNLQNNNNGITSVRFQHLKLPCVDYMGGPSYVYYPLLLKYTLGDGIDRVKQQQHLKLHDCFNHFSSISLRTPIPWDLATELFKLETVRDLEIALTFIQNPDYMWYEELTKECSNTFIEEYSRTMESISLNTNLQRLKLTLYPLYDDFNQGLDHFTHKYYNRHADAITKLCRSIGSHQKLNKLAITGIPYRESTHDAAKFLFNSVSLTSIAFSFLYQDDLKTISNIFTEVQNPNIRFLSIHFNGYRSNNKDEMNSHIGDIGKILTSSMYLKKLIFVYREYKYDDIDIDQDSQLFNLASNNPNKNIVFQYAPFSFGDKKGIYYSHNDGADYDHIYRHAWRICNSKTYGV